MPSRLCLMHIRRTNPPVKRSSDALDSLSTGSARSHIMPNDGDGRDHASSVELVSSSFYGLPVGGGPCHTMEGGPSASDSCMVYGELTYGGMEVLHDALNLQSHDALYDLGSGCGKFVLYAALRNVCESATGVEVGVKRHVSAEKACTRLGELLQLERESVAPENGRCANVHAVLGDITQPIYRDATAIVVCNIMFGSTLNAGIMANILHKCPRVTQVASIVQLRHPRFKKRRIVNVGCTWSRAGVSWTLYEILPPAVMSRTAMSDIRNAPVVKWTRPSVMRDASAELRSSRGLVGGGSSSRPMSVSGAATAPRQGAWRRLAATPLLRSPRGGDARATTAAAAAAAAGGASRPATTGASLLSSALVESGGGRRAHRGLPIPLSTSALDPSISKLSLSKQQQPLQPTLGCLRPYAPAAAASVLAESPAAAVTNCEALV